MRLPKPCAGKKLLAIEQPKMQRLPVLAVEFGIGAVLLDNEDVDAELEHFVELERRELLKPSHVHPVWPALHQ